MAKNQAIRPSSFISSLPTFVKEQTASKKGMADEEIHLATLAEQKGWGIYEEYVGRIIEEMEALNDVAIANGMSREQIGENTIIISQVKQIIRKSLNKVNDAKEARDKELDEQAKEPKGKTGD